MDISKVLLFALIMGLLMMLSGILIRRYPKQGKFFNINSDITIENLLKNKFIRLMIPAFLKRQDSRLYRLSQKIIKSSETNISVEALYVLKIISMVCITIIVLLIKNTNIDIEKTAIISQINENNVFAESSPKTHEYNLALYKAVVKNIGEKRLQEIDDKSKAEEVKKAIPALIKSNNKELIESKALSFVKTFNAVESIKLLDFQIILIAICAFWLPEVLLLLKKLLISNMYKKEVIKLENVFELLGSVRDFKTIDILNEMASCSNVYRKYLRSSIEVFQTDKKIALDYLKTAVKNKRFSRLVEIIRTYSLIDKQLAIQILVRNRLEKEEQIILTSQEDIDIVDIIAFISIIPALYYLVSLLLKPMMDMIFEAFKYI